MANVLQLDIIQNLIDKFAQEWQETVQTSKGWFFNYKGTLSDVTKFLIKCLDELINSIDELVESGADKKVTVLAATAAIYDFIIKEAMPFWMKPFAEPIKKFILNIIISNSIDFIVEKYRNGSWRKVLDKEVTNGEPQEQQT